MWDYDKLFAEGNIVGMKLTNDCIHPMVIDNKGVSNDFKKNYGNDNLYCCGYQVQYIIHLDEHGNVIEKLFDRDTDMPEPMPELETGMFVKVKHENEEKLGYIDVEHNKVIYQSGGWDEIEGDYGIICCSFIEILAIYEQDATCFDGCCKNKIIWRKPESK